MVVLLLRHGKAEAGGPGLPDEERTLSEEGEAELRELAPVLKDLGAHADLILSSPHVRAVQTADIVGRALGVTVVASPALVPSAEPEDVEDLLASYADTPTLLLVAHQPLLGNLLWRWTRAEAPLPPGTLVVLELESPRPGGGILRGLYEPDRLLLLAGRGAREP